MDVMVLLATLCFEVFFRPDFVSFSLDERCFFSLFSFLELLDECFTFDESSLGLTVFVCKSGALVTRSAKDGGGAFLHGRFAIMTMSSILKLFPIKTLLLSLTICHSSFPVRFVGTRLSISTFFTV
jgi:hypothetical protein